MTTTISDVKAILDKVQNLQNSSVKTYIGHVKLFSKDRNQPDIKLMLNDYKGMDKYIQEKKSQRSKFTEPVTLKTKQTYYITLKAMSDHLPFITPDAKKFYTERQNEYNRLGSQKSGENEAEERFGPEGLPPWSDFVGLADKFMETQGSKYGVNHLIVALYTLIPPRRAEYRTLIYLKDAPDWQPHVKPKKSSALRDENGHPYNFIYPKDGSYEMVLGSYKTDFRYGVYKALLPKELGDVIAGYIKKQKVEDNQVLIHTTHGKPLKENSFSNKVKYAIKVKYFKHDITIRNLRHIYITSNIKGRMTTNQKERIAQQMGHSLGMQDRYRQHVTLDTEVESDDEDENEGEEHVTNHDEGAANEQEPQYEQQEQQEQPQSQSESNNHEPQESLDDLYMRLGKAYMEVEIVKALILKRLEQQ